MEEMKMRLIDADAMMETIKTHHYILIDSINSTDYGMFTVGIQQAVDEQPTIDPVHAAGACYCRECIWRGREECAMFYRCDCGEQHTWETDNDFCSYGELKEENNGTTL